MPSKTKEWSADQYPQIEELTTLSNQIFEYVAGEQWEQLITTLHVRQQCLETLFSEAAAEPEILKSLANSILEQDAIFIIRIQEQKKNSRKTDIGTR